MMKIKSLLIYGLVWLLLIGCGEANRAGPKLYALNCGEMDVKDMAGFSDDGSLKGKGYSLVVPCFLIRHPKGDLVWDTGLAMDKQIGSEGLRFGDFTYYMKTDLQSQLAALQLTAKDIEYMALSHHHSDHSGKANLFAQSTFLINRAEHNTMFNGVYKPGTDPHIHFDQLEKAKTVKFDTMYDVFGDGSVTIHHLPGHTQGHSVLLIKPQNSQPLLLSGDLYIFSEGREKQLVPSFNQNKQQTVDSMKKFETLARVHNAKVVIQHEPSDFAALPKFPLFVD